MNNGKKIINSLQVIRAVGCLSVIMCHTAFTNFGQTGVDFFLIISGFVIMYSTEQIGKVQYWRKRLKKVLPLYWFITIFTSILVIVAPNLFNSYEVSAEYLLKSLFFVPYYHNNIAGPIMALGWTLNYEMFFYFIFWIALSINRRYRGVIVVILLCGLVIVGRLLELPLIVEYWCNPIVIEFCYGILIYYIYMSKGKTMRKYADKVSRGATNTILYVVLISSICFMEYCYMTLSISRTFHVGIFASIVVLLFLVFDDYLYKPKVLIKIGSRSYQIYLLHIFCVRVIELLFMDIIKVPILILAMDIMGAVILVNLLCNAFSKCVQERVLFCIGKKKNV